MSKRKLYKVWVNFEDLIIAESAEDAKEKFHQEHPDVLEGIGDSMVECEEFDKIVRKNKEEEASSEPSTDGIDKQKTVRLKD